MKTKCISVQKSDAYINMKNKAKKMLEFAVMLLLTPVLFQAMIIHTAYKMWYFRHKIVRKYLIPAEDIEEKTDNGDSNGC